MHIYVPLLLALIPPLEAAEPLRSGCFVDDEQIAEVRADDVVEVNSALATDTKICYRISLTREGQKLSGYVIGDALPAIAIFVEQREKISRASYEARAREAAIAALKPVAAEKNQEPAKPPGTPEIFENFSGRDAKGNTVSLSSIKGRVILVTFWSPKGGTSKQRLISILPLYKQFSRRGLGAIGVSTDANAEHITDALDDVTLGWPQVADRSGLATRYGVDSK